MRMKRMGLKSSHSRGTEEALSQEILIQCTQLRRHASGIYGLGNVLLKARNNVVEIVRNKLEEYECAEISLPIIQPKQLWMDSGRWNGYVSNNQMFHFEGRNGEYCLAPTGEEIVFDFVNNSITSYKDLPINIFQIGMKYRDEIRVRGGLLRSKEFLMKDGYSFHVTKEDMEREYETMKRCYYEIFSKLGVEAIPVRAVSAEMGGKVSEEFMLISDIGEDKMLYSESSNLALNVEVLEEKELLDSFLKQHEGVKLEDFVKKSCIELGHIFQLGTFYSESMNGYFTDSDGIKKPYYMGCYGIGINRLLGAICEKNCDEEGLKWPLSVAPYICSIVAVKGNEEVAESIYKMLNKEGVPVLLDDRNAGIGAKLKDSKLLGIPYLIIIGKSFLENGLVEIESRLDSNKIFLEVEQLICRMKKINNER